MAAETSIDAQIPVVMALVKLALFYGVDVFSKEVRRSVDITVICLREIVYKALFKKPTPQHYIKCKHTNENKNMNILHHNSKTVYCYKIILKTISVLDSDLHWI